MHFFSHFSFYDFCHISFIHFILFFHSPLLLPNISSLSFSLPLSLFLLSLPVFLCRSAVNVEAKEGKELKEGKEWKEVNKEGREVETSRPVSVMSSLSYRKRSNLSSKGDALFSQNAESEDTLSFHKPKPQASDFQNDAYLASSRRKSQVLDGMNDRQSVISQAYSEANSQARKGLDSRWSNFNEESTISFTAPSRASTFLGLNPENDAKSNVSLGLSSPLGRHQSTSRLDKGRGSRSQYSSGPSSPCYSRRFGGCSPGSVSRPDSVAYSCRLSEFDVDIDDSRSVAVTERSAYSPHSSTGRSISMPPPQVRSNFENDAVDNLDVKTVSHCNYLDPDLEKAINEVLSFKPIKFKRRTLEDSDCEEEKFNNNEADRKDTHPVNSLRRSASAADCMRPASSCSSRSSRHRHSSKGKSKKKKRSHSSDSDSSENGHRHRSSSKRRSKKSQKKSKRKDESLSSSSSSSSSESESSSDASTISYRSSSSVKRAPARKASSPEVDEEAGSQSKTQPLNKKDEKKRKKKVDSLMMKYLYRPESD